MENNYVPKYSQAWEDQVAARDLDRGYEIVVRTCYERVGPELGEIAQRLFFQDQPLREIQSTESEQT